jgi:hypothetical protein
VLAQGGRVTAGIARQFAAWQICCPCWPAHPVSSKKHAGLWRSWTRTMIIDEVAQEGGDTSLTA